MSQIIMINKLEPYTGTYEDITNSGNLNLIKSFDLKTKIVNYQLSIKGAGFVDEFFYKYVSDFVMPFTFDEFDIINGEFQNNEIINSYKFSNVFAGYFSMIQQRYFTYKSLLLESYSYREALKENIN